MRVFVTGATGFVGSHLVEHLLEAGHRPVCLVRKTSNTAHLEGLGVETVRGTMDDVAALEAALADCDAVVHIAGIIKARTPDEFYRVNADATAELAQLAARANPTMSRFVHVSSVAAQGPSPVHGPRPCELEPAPVSHYGKSKLAGELEVRALADRIPVSVIRPPAVYGPRDHEMLQIFQLANRRLAPLYGTGEATLSLVHVFDLCDAIVSCLTHAHPSGSVFTVDDGGVYTWAEMSALIAAAFGKSTFKIKLPPLVFELAARASETYGRLTDRTVIFTRDKLAEMRQTSWVCGHDAIRDVLGWQPNWPLERGAHQVASWYREAGWL